MHAARALATAGNDGATDGRISVSKGRKRQTNAWALSPSLSPLNPPLALALEQRNQSSSLESSRAGEREGARPTDRPTDGSLETGRLRHSRCRRRCHTYARTVQTRLLLLPASAPSPALSAPLVRFHTLPRPTIHPPPLLIVVRVVSQYFTWEELAGM